MSLTHVQIFEQRPLQPCPHLQPILWKLKERRPGQRGPKSAASTCRRVKTDQLQFRILRRSIIS